VTIPAEVISGWSDWVNAWRVIVRNLDAIGIAVKLQLVPTLAEWQEDAFSTRVATLLWSYGTGSTPYGYFASNLDRAAFVPAGRQADATGDWEHFQSAEGTRLLRAFRATSDRGEQRRITAQLAAVWLRAMPFVPLFSGPTWSTYSTRHFTGFPSKRDFYVEPTFSDASYVVALTRIRPVAR
jgi:peptide/nickel transport system substrate-binding protein